MRWLRTLSVVVPLLLLAVVLDATFGSIVGSGGIDPYLMLTIWYGAHGRKADGMGVGALAGLTQDVLGSVVLGTQYLSKVVVGYVTTLVATHLISGQLITHALLLAGGTILENVVLASVGALVGRQLAGDSILAVLGAIVGNVVVGTALFALADRLLSRRERMMGMGRGPRGR